MKRDLREASIIVAGASGALGHELCRRLIQQGADLTLLGRDEDKLTGLGLPGLPIVGDLTDPDACRRAVAGAVAAHGRLDGILNAAGVVAFGTIDTVSDDAIDELVGTNFLGPLHLMRAGLADLEPGGFIANLSAVVAERPTAGMAVYSASKAALTALDHALARELRRRKIDVIDIRPPHTETGLAERPIEGVAPRLPQGLDPGFVADRIVQAMLDGERELPSNAFSAQASA
ncbi:MAG: SDR family NAD(P)-dependent oxidoreductase [Myxococcota bacterium]